MSEHAEEEQVTQLSGLGLSLRKGRESKGYTVEHVADELHLRPSIVIAMEEENYKLLPTDIFLKGYIRSYARLVELSEVEVIQLLEKHLGRETKLEADIKLAKGKKKRNKRSKYALILITIVALLAGAAYYVGEKLIRSNTDSPQIELKSSTPKPAETIIDSSQVEATGSTPDMSTDDFPEDDVQGFEPIEETTVVVESVAIEESEVINEPDVADVTEALNVSQDLNDSEVIETVEAIETTEVTEIADTTEAAETTEVAETVDTSEATETSEVLVDPENTPAVEVLVEADAEQEIAPQVVLEKGSINVIFFGESWFTLKNGTGKTVIADLKQAGEEINYTGELPFSVVIGAVSEVAVLFNGKAVDFSTVRIRNNRASLELTQ